MNTVATPKLREFAVRLLDYEIAAAHPKANRAEAALSVCDKLRGSLSALAGAEGFGVLFSRAVSLAKAEVPWLSAVRVNADGTLAGFLEANSKLSKKEAARGGAVIIANLLGLLVAFLGEELALSLVRRIWPQTGFAEEENRMSKEAKAIINKLPTGVPGLDEIMGGGLPEFSFNIIAGAPGSGKTTMAHQFAFANATEERPALYFTILGEPAIKMLRYQQQYSFFDPAKVGTAIRFSNLSNILLEGGLNGVLEEITRAVKETNPGIVVVDSFRTVVRKARSENGEMELQAFVQRLALLLTGWQATTFLVGEYAESEIRNDPVFTVADALVLLYQSVERSSVVRKLQIMKLRGQASVPGLHTIRITDAGVQAYSRTLGLTARKAKPLSRRRLSIGVPALDKMLGGGVFEGDSILLAGPSGAGKSVLATQFIAAGIREGEPGIVAIFEERPQEYTSRAESFGLDLEAPQHSNKLEILYLRPMDLSVDETMQEILDAVKRIGAKRLVIDSLAGFEMALAPAFRTEFRESLYRMIGALTGAGITILSTVEMEESFIEFPFSPYAISFLTDDIIRLRYVEIGGQLRKILVVIKMRGGNHSKDIREYVITAEGLVVIGPRRTGYSRLTTGIPERTGQLEELPPEAKGGEAEPYES